MVRTTVISNSNHLSREEQIEFPEHDLDKWSGVHAMVASKPNCELFRKSFMYPAAAIWNSLPLHVKNATSVNTFKCLYLKWKRLNDH